MRRKNARPRAHPAMSERATDSARRRAAPIFSGEKVDSLHERVGRHDEQTLGAENRSVVARADDEVVAPPDRFAKAIDEPVLRRHGRDDGVRSSRVATVSGSESGPDT